MVHIQDFQFENVAMVTFIIFNLIIFKQYHRHVKHE